LLLSSFTKDATANSFQIRNLPAHPNQTNVEADAPARVSAGGVVTETDESQDAFFMTSWQDMFRIPLLSPLTIQATMRLKDSFLRRFQPLPEPHSIIHFTGDLNTVQHGTALVAIDDHSYFDAKGDEFDTVDDVPEIWPTFDSEEVW
jgi:hypothetical protein